MSLVFDTSDFDKKFMNIIKRTIPELTEKGLGRATLQLLNDCVMEIPTVPLKEGWLRGSGSAFVQNKLIGMSSFGKKKFANADHADYLGYGNFIGVVGFNAPYAARLHEGVGFRFTEPSSGAKYLESKLHRNKDRYAEIIANTIKEGGK
jgi:hypothetical protein